MSVVDSPAELRDSGTLVPAKPPRRTPPPPPPSASEAPADEAPPAEGSPSIAWRLVSMPGWLVSLIVHLVVLITLALWMLPEVTRYQPQTLEVGMAEPYALQTVESFAIQTLENTAEPTASAPAGELGELSDLTQQLSLGDGAALAGSSPEIDPVDVGGMQDLFATAGAGMKSIGGKGESAEFFGVKAGGRKFVFIVDSSNSMRGQKFTDAKKELMIAVRKLKKTQSFYVIFFDQDALRMFDDDKRDPEPRPVAATPDNISKLERWLYFVDNERRTDPYDAVKFAVEMRPDAIYILSDGQFTDRGRTEQYLEANNVINDPVEGYVPRVVIHTVGFYSKEGEVTLSAIAKAYKGTYRFVPSPNGKKK